MAQDKQMRSEEEIRKELAERQRINKEYEAKMPTLPTGGLQKLSMKSAYETNAHVIAVLRWVLGEDLLWE